MNIGIIGHAADKFDARTEALAKEKILEIAMLARARTPVTERLTVVSGGCHLGGVDIWAEELADTVPLAKLIHRPEKLAWEGGYKQRNLLIARDSDEVHVIVVRELPPGFSGMKHSFCYHCGKSDHVKSGACWTAKQAQKLGKPAFWHLIESLASEPGER